MTATVVGRLRVRHVAGVDADPAPAVGRRIAALDLAPATMAPSAVLCIRSLVDPAPGTLRLDDCDPVAGPAWAAAVASSIDRLARGAARPADGPVPAGAEAVLFRDRVELLAWLAEASSRPGGREAWWWRSLAEGGLGGPGDLASGWRRSPELVPATIDLLERRGSLPMALSRLTDEQAFDLAAEVAHAAQLPSLALAVDKQAGRGHPGTTIDQWRTSTVPTAGRRDPTDDARLDRRIAALTDLSSLSRGAAVLAAIGLAVHRRPGLAHDRGFADALWRIARDGADPMDGGPSAASDAGRPSRLASADRDGGPASSAASLGDGGARGSARDGPARAAGWNWALVSPAVDAPALDQGTGEPTQVADMSPPSAVADLDVRTTDGGVHTDLGGAFSLLVLAVSLGLYGDFSRPAAPGIGLDPWDLVTLLAIELGAHDAAPDDPMWTLLADLATRQPPARPGSGWRPPATWRVPSDWLRHVPDRRAWRWDRLGDRVRVEHPAGFAVLDGRVRGRGVEAVRRRLAGSEPVPALRRGRVRPPDRRRAVDRWAAELAAYVRAVASPALGARDDRALRRILLERPARVHVGPGTCDVVMSLDDLPFVVRAAGLDRDLGWVPAARRSVQFHYR